LGPMLERLIAANDVERCVRKRDRSRMAVTALAELRRDTAIDKRLDTGPTAAAHLDDVLGIRPACVADLEHLEAARVAQVRFGRGYDALAQRAAERHAAF